jgi:hypothetical protein
VATARAEACPVAAVLVYGQVTALPRAVPVVSSRILSAEMNLVQPPTEVKQFGLEFLANILADSLRSYLLAADGTDSLGVSRVSRLTVLDLYGPNLLRAVPDVAALLHVFSEHCGLLAGSCFADKKNHTASR